jgi:hypothetical protein
MKQEDVKYFVSADNYSHFRVNFTKKLIIRISNNKKSYPLFKDLAALTEKYKLEKSNKDKWLLAENEFYQSSLFEWEYKGDLYRTSDIPYSERALQANTDPNTMVNYPDLVFHNGELWATGYFGNYYPRCPLVRYDSKGQQKTKWTSVKNIRNFEKVER